MNKKNIREKSNFYLCENLDDESQSPHSGVHILIGQQKLRILKGQPVVQTQIPFLLRRPVSKLHDRHLKRPIYLPQNLKIAHPLSLSLKYLCLRNCSAGVELLAFLHDLRDVNHNVAHLLVGVLLRDVVRIDEAHADVHIARVESKTVDAGTEHF